MSEIVNGYHVCNGQPDPPVVRGWPLRLQWDVVPLSQAVGEIVSSHDTGDEDDHFNATRVKSRLLRGLSVATKYGVCYTRESVWPGYPVRNFAVLAHVAWAARDDGVRELVLGASRPHP